MLIDNPAIKRHKWVSARHDYWEYFEVFLAFQARRVAFCHTEAFCIAVIYQPLVIKAFIELEICHGAAVSALRERGH